jgi:hypothetical protein
MGMERRPYEQLTTRAQHRVREERAQIVARHQTYQRLQQQTFEVWTGVIIAVGLALWALAGGLRGPISAAAWERMVEELMLSGCFGMVYRELVLIRYAARLHLPQGRYTDPWGRPLPGTQSPSEDSEPRQGQDEE